MGGVEGEGKLRADRGLVGRGSPQGKREVRFGVVKAKREGQEMEREKKLRGTGVIEENEAKTMTMRE